MQSVLRAVKLTKRYGSFTAVDAIDLEVHEGEVFGILGPNGAGKTSTIRMTTCISPVDGGELLVDGLDVTQMPRTIKGILGVVQQEDNLDTDLNVMQNLLTHARYYGISRSEAQARAQEVAKMEVCIRAREEEHSHLACGLASAMAARKAGQAWAADRCAVLNTNLLSVEDMLKEDRGRLAAPRRWHRLVSFGPGHEQGGC